MPVSAFDLFKIGIGPSSSHTVGPMRAARAFATLLANTDGADEVVRVKVDLYGSLGTTGRGHGTGKAVLLGLEGESPETVAPQAIAERVAAIRGNGRLCLAGGHTIAFDANNDLIYHTGQALDFHPNGLTFNAFNRAGSLLCKTYFSVGGGFVVDEDSIVAESPGSTMASLPFPFRSAAELLELSARHGLKIWQIMFANEKVWRTAEDIHSGLMAVWAVMRECVSAGCETEGVLPGGLNLRRRAPGLYRALMAQPDAAREDALTVLDWISLYALAVNEENAAGSRVVTAPTNGAAGIIPAVAHYYMAFVPGAQEQDLVRYLLTAAAIGILFKENASISGAEVGCQGEVGSACAMAAGALTELLGGTSEQIENAAEIAMEHNLGLTCDPVGGLVQVPCIERNAMAAIKAVSAARMALRGDGKHFVSLDRVIQTLRDTGRDMQDKYKETALGGLAVNAVDVPVNIIEC